MTSIWLIMPPSGSSRDQHLAHHVNFSRELTLVLYLLLLFAVRFPSGYHVVSINVFIGTEALRCGPSSPVPAAAISIAHVLRDLVETTLPPAEMTPSQRVSASIEMRTPKTAGALSLRARYTASHYRIYCSPLPCVFLARTCGRTEPRTP